MKKNKEEKENPIINVILIIIVSYFAIAGIIWSVRNPTANAMTFWSYFPSVMKFEKLPEFQP